MKKHFVLLFLASSILSLQAQETPPESVPATMETAPSAPEEPAIPAPEPPAATPPETSTIAPATQTPSAPAPTSPPPSSPVQASPAQPDDDSQPAPYSTEKKKVKPAAPKALRIIPQQVGDTSGEVFIGHRTVIDRYAGWGWIRREKDGWNRARWVMLEEKPGVMFAPGRYLGNPDSDKGNQYRLYGQWAPYKGYEPNYDVFVDVFQIKGFELLGPGELPKMTPPRSKRGRADTDGTYQRRAGVVR